MLATNGWPSWRSLVRDEAGVIGGIKINFLIYVGDTILRKTNSILSKGEDVVVCLPGALTDNNDLNSRVDPGGEEMQVRDEQYR